MKLENKYIIGNEPVKEINKKGHISFFENDNGEVYVVDRDTVIARITADCAQNIGFISDVEVF